MNSAIRVVDRLRPLIVVGAVGLHAIAAASMPDYVARVSEMFDESSFVEVEAVAPEPEPEVVPQPVERVTARVETRPVERETPAVAETPIPDETPPPPVAVVPTPPVENTTQAAPSDPLTGTGGSVTVATTGAVGASSGRGTDSNATGSAIAQPAIDLRALMRSYRGDVARAIGRIPPLRGTREQLDAEVIVGMHLAADGRISDVRVVRSSGHAVIDQHVVDFIRGLRRLPSPPAELELSGAREFTYRVSVGS